jgi:hypothetical protein
MPAQKPAYDVCSSCIYSCQTRKQAGWPSGDKWVDELWPVKQQCTTERKKSLDPGGSPTILAAQEAALMRITDQSQPGQIVCKTLSQKTLHKKGLVEWLKVSLS